MSVISASGKPNAVMANIAYIAPDEPREYWPSVAAFFADTIVASDAADAPAAADELERRTLGEGVAALSLAIILG